MSCAKLKYRATDGKNYTMDFADAKTLYTITQRMDAETGIRNKDLTIFQVQAYSLIMRVSHNTIRRNSSRLSTINYSAEVSPTMKRRKILKRAKS